MNHLPIYLLASLLWWAACQSHPEAPPDQAQPTAAVSQADDYHNRTHLLEVAEVLPLLTQPDVLLLEVSKPDEYAKGHLPGAHHIWRPHYANASDYAYGGMMASIATLEALLSGYGADAETRILLYDAKGNVDASRLQWILHEYGHAHTALINGGKAAWLAADLPLAHERPEPRQAQFRFASLTYQPRQAATLDEVLAALDDPNVVLVDTRTAEEYHGLTQKQGAARAGRIPGAVHLDWAESVNYDGDFCFKSVRALRYLYERAGITPDKRIITYCHSGVRSAHTAFVLSHLLGYPEVVNYDGSWTEWSHHAHLPIEVSPATAAQP